MAGILHEEVQFQVVMNKSHVALGHPGFSRLRVARDPGSFSCGRSARLDSKPHLRLVYYDGVCLP